MLKEMTELFTGIYKNRCKVSITSVVIYAEDDDDFMGIVHIFSPILIL